jgi:hypothetical protein
LLLFIDAVVMLVSQPGVGVMVGVNVTVGEGVRVGVDVDDGVRVGVGCPHEANLKLPMRVCQLLPVV